MNNIPECKGFKSWTDIGYEYDCEYDIDFSCDDCICVTSSYGDLTGYDPRTNKRFIKEK